MNPETDIDRQILLIRIPEGAAGLFRTLTPHPQAEPPAAPGQGEHEFLDVARQMLIDGRVVAGMSYLTCNLMHRRREWSHERWVEFCRGDCRRHPLHALIQQDPFTCYSFCRPRGYPGDARLQDMMYQLPSLPRTTRLGREIYNFTINAAAPQSVRARRVTLAACIDEIAVREPAARILAVGAGHLREASVSEAVRSREIGLLTAFDQDKQAVDFIEREYHGHNIDARLGTVQAVLSGKIEFEDYDFIYSPSLYNYLDQATASRLSAALFKYLRPGGRLLLANFLPSLRDIGYREAFMNWGSVYRTPGELMATVDKSADRIADSLCFYDPAGNMAFLEIRKK